MGISELLNSIDGIRDNVNEAFGLGGSTPKHNQKFNYATNAPQYNQGNWRASYGYGFQVVRTYSKEGDGWTSEVQDTSGNEWQEFTLQINPQELMQDEVFAIEVTPTLRGVLVEHHGVTIKDIQISGTTGISPMRREGGAMPASGNPVMAKGRSGYQEFHELRSYFRVYAEQKRLDPGEGGELRMIFKNYRDEEYLFVEPQKFSMKRSATRPHMYDYQIVLKGIGQAVGNKQTRDKWYEKLEDTVRKVQDYLDLGVRLIQAGSGIILRTERDIFDTLINPVIKINQAITAWQAGGNLITQGARSAQSTLSAYGVIKTDVEDKKNIATAKAANFNDVIGIDTEAYSKAVGRTRTVVGTPGRQPTYQELSILNGLNKIEKGLTMLAALGNDVFEADVFTTNADAANRYVDARGNRKLALVTPSSVREVQTLGTDNIQILATRELGDPDRYREIVILNNLKPPYLDPAGGPGVKKPGEKILIPQNNPVSPTGVALNGKQYNITANMNEIEKQLGVDLRITKDGDLAISNTSDLDLVAGLDNMVQAIVVRLGLERGSLKRHRSIGVNLQIGRKVGNSLREIKQEIISTYSQDARVESIPFLEMKQEGGTTIINMLIKLRDLEQPVPVPIVLNNG